MNMTPSVAVIIPTYNRPHFLVQALESVLNQTRKPDEILVVDDGSTASTAEALAGYRDRIRYLRKPNGGLPSALNHGLAATDADYICILDDDDLAVPDALERHLGFLHSRPDIDFSYSGCYRFWGESPPKPPYAEHLELYDCADHGPADLFLHALETYPFHTQGMMVPLRCYGAINGFDDTRLRSEDYDMILRLARKFRGAKLPAPAFLLREHSGDRGPARERHSVRDRDKVFLQHARKLFADVRDRLALEEYVRQVEKTVPLNNAGRRVALLQRACIMARHGLFDEALEDLEAATVRPLLEHPLTPEEERMCSRMMDMDPMLLDQGAAFIRQATQTLYHRAPALSYDCVKGFGWSITREFRHGHYRTAAAMTGILVKALGGRGCLSLIGKARARRALDGI